MIRPVIEVSCSDCGEVFDKKNFDSVAAAHEAVIAAKWEVHPLHAIWIHFCPRCQSNTMKSTAAAASSK